MPAILKIITATIIWGSLGVFVRHIHIPSLEAAFLRSFIAVAFLSLIFLFLKEKKLNGLRENISVLMLSGALIGFNWVLLFQAYRYTTIANATLTYYLSPVLIVLLAPLIGEKMSANKIIAVLGGMTGLSIIISQQALVTNSSYQHGVGIAYGLVAAMSYAGVVLLNKKIKNIDGFQITIVQLATASLVLLPFYIARNNFYVPQGDIIFILILGLVHTGLAFLLYLTGLKELKAQSVALLSYLDPISAVLFGILLLNEPMTLWQMLGGLLILGSAYYGTKEKKSADAQITKPAS